MGDRCEIGGGPSSHSCKICGKPCHIPCGLPQDEDEEGFASSLICKKWGNEPSKDRLIHLKYFYYMRSSKSIYMQKLLSASHHAE